MDEMSFYKYTPHRAIAGNQPLLLEYRPQLDMGLVVRLLGARNRRALTRTTKHRIKQLSDPVLGCLDPKVTWKSFGIRTRDDRSVTLDNGIRLRSRKMAGTLDNVKRLVCFVATVGKSIDEMIESSMSRGDYADSYVIDAMGSGAVEQTASEFQKDYIDNIASSPYEPGLRFSPGYCDWPLTEQEKIFSLLDCRKIGVSLSDSALMTPRKSVSAIFGLHVAPTLDVGHIRYCPDVVMAGSDHLVLTVQGKSAHGANPYRGVD
ncbi:MAG: vitamin B12 dependent-methionine synthase activation domain-containing protein, partial [Desulforhopalus sp.]